MQDEKDTNNNLIEQMGIAYTEALEAGNIEQCRAIIAEIKNMDTFVAKTLEFELLDTPIINFKA